ncbi:MAG: homoserine dehydrogenase [Polyangiaceae bacterium]|nr:homoserine dehydrogenase [Polyangiaceae bacterium]
MEQASQERGEGARRVRIGMLGCGTVGAAVLGLLAEHHERLDRRVGATLEVAKVAVRDAARARPVGPELLTTSVDEVLADPTIDVVVELIGGAAALAWVERALEAGKSVVTANKLLLARHGGRLVELASRHGVDLAFEGAVGGGIPIVRTLREAFASDHVTSLTGILNGTSNFVLSKMLDDGASFEAALAEAQALGYAEADPTLDVGGHDAAQKLEVLAMLAFGARPGTGCSLVEGITAIEPVDHRFAARFGYRIKHLVIGRDHGDVIELRAHPTLIPERSVLANVSGVLNAVLLEGRALGPCLVYGRGAGGAPTAVSVVADLIDVCRSVAAGVRGLGTRGIGLRERRVAASAASESRYYVRFRVADRPGVMARLAGALGSHEVSIEQMVQDGEPVRPGAAATVVMLTHRAREAQVQAALAELRPEGFLIEPPRVLRIEQV